MQYCRRLLVGIDALACILAIGLDRSAVLSSTFGWNWCSRLHSGDRARQKCSTVNAFVDTLNIWNGCPQHALLGHICASHACFEYISTLKSYKKSVFRWHISLIHLMFKTCVLNTLCWCIVLVLITFEHSKVIKRTCFGNTFRWYTQHLKWVSSTRFAGSPLCITCLFWGRVNPEML